MRSKAKPGESFSFNMTPMIDIVFQLIIFFMLVSQFYRLSIEDVKLPPASKAEPKREELEKYSQIVVNVVPPLGGDKTTRVIIDSVVIVESVEFGEYPNWQPLIDLLKSRREAAEKGGQKPINVILRAGESVPYETIGSVMLATSHAGISNWWVQAWRPNPRLPEGQAQLRELGVTGGI